MVGKQTRNRPSYFRAFLQGSPRALAECLLTTNPWLCDQVEIDFAAWAKPLLRDHDLPSAALYLLGSAATGFSLKAEQPGRPFKRIGGTRSPSDLDLGMVDEALFDSCWNEMTREERGICHYLEDWDRIHVYWGIIDDYKLPARAKLKITLRNLQNAITSSPEFRGYPASIRVYRTHDDLIGYLESSIQRLRRRTRK